MTDIRKTKNYDMFKFRNDNRLKVDNWHVNGLVDSIRRQNMLEFRPILVNGDMEIIDGQNRLRAAKILGVDIYYQIKQDLEAKDIIILNAHQKNWVMGDYHNFYVKNGYKEYQKLQEFMVKNNVQLKVALMLTFGQTKEKYRDFREGKYIFKMENSNETLGYVWQTVDYIKKHNGFANFTLSSRFWIALLALFNHDDFLAEKWFHNLTRHVEKITPKANIKSYKKLFQDVYNWQNRKKVDLMGEEEDSDLKEAM